MLTSHHVDKEAFPKGDPCLCRTGLNIARDVKRLMDVTEFAFMPPMHHSQSTFNLTCLCPQGWHRVLGALCSEYNSVEAK